MPSCLLLAVVAGLILCGQTEGQSPAQALQQFRTENPGARFYGSGFYRPESPDDEASGGMSAIYGTVLAMGETPELSAWNHVEDLRGVLGADIGTLVPQIRENGDAVQGVMWNPATRSHRFSVLRFNQFCRGIPVFRSGIGFLVRNQPGFPLVMSGSTVKDLGGVQLQLPEPGTRAEVDQRMLARVNELMNAVPVEQSVVEGRRRPARPRIETSEEQYVVFAGVDGRFAVPELAVSFVASRGTINSMPDYHKYLVVASVATGKILHEETQICFCSSCMVNIQGTVSGRATQGLNALECDPESAVPLRHAEVSVAGGSTAYADANGNFSIPHPGSTAVNVTSSLRGRYFEVRDQAAANAIPSITTSVTPPGPAAFLHNPTTTNDLMTANVNAYVEANVVRDFVLATEPAFPVIAGQTFFDINTNIANSCNAFYNGTSINFYQKGGTCNNTSFSDVVYHEYGHHLINVTGNGQGQMGEGSGDVIGVLIQDEPVLGQGFSNCGVGIRNANNNLQYPCTGAIHTCGQLISGCVWSTRNELIVTEPANYLNISTELFLGMLIVRGQMDPGQVTIAPDITVIYLELDDDDADIGNGTPHYQEIAAGFGAHNMDAPPLSTLAFNYPNGRPELIPHHGEAAFEVEVLPLLQNPQPGTGRLYVDAGNGNGFQQYAMTQSAPNVYQATFPAIPCGTVVRYYVSAESTGGTAMSDPKAAPDASYSGLAAATVNTVFYDDGETNAGWTVSGNATDGQWNRGVPVGGGTRGDPVTDGDGSGACWLTDNVAGNSDVDGGSTILTSPVLDASHSYPEVPLIQYWRFYSNNFGGDPLNDIFVVEISNNGGASWVNLETVGPAGPEAMGGWYHKSFRISDFLTPTANMRIRFNASDLGTGSVVEAAVDGVRIAMATCDRQINPLNYRIRKGVFAGGTLADAHTSNDQYFMAEPKPDATPTEQIVVTVLRSVSDVDVPTSLKFRLEAAMTGGPSGSVSQTIYLWDWTPGAGWVAVDSRAASSSDLVVNGVPGGDPARFVNPANREIMTMIVWNSPSFSGPPFFWSIEMDQAVWLIE